MPPVLLLPPPAARRRLSRRALLGWAAAIGAPAAATSALAGCAAGAGRGEQTPSAIPSVPTPPSAPRPTATARPTGVTVDSRAPSLPGRLLFVSDANIWLLERSQVRRLTPDRISRQPAWSRDGQKIAHVKLATSGSDLWMMNADGSNSEELTDNEFQEDLKQRFALRPIWWPDGSRLLYLSEERSQDMQLWQLTVATRRRQPFFAALGERLGGLDSPKLSPDGTVIVATSFQAGRGPAGRPQIWTYTLPNGAPRQLTSAPDGAYDPAWSPDGRRIVFTTRSGARHDIWVMRADGANARQVTATGACRAPSWSPDGAWLAYYSAQSGTFDVWAVAAPADAGPPDAAGAAATGATPAAAPAAAAPATAPPRQVTRTGVCEATSGLAWAP